MQLHELIDDGLVVRRLKVKNQDVVFVKGIFDASEGLCAMYAERGGDLTVVAPTSRSSELDVVLRDLAGELQGVLDDGEGSSNESNESAVMGAKAPVP